MNLFSLSEVTHLGFNTSLPYRNYHSTILLREYSVLEQEHLCFSLLYCRFSVSTIIVNELILDVLLFKSCLKNRCW